VLKTVKQEKKNASSPSKKKQKKYAKTWVRYLHKEQPNLQLDGKAKKKKKSRVRPRLQKTKRATSKLGTQRTRSICWAMQGKVKARLAEKG